VGKHPPVGSDQGGRSFIATGFDAKDQAHPLSSIGGSR
jgi:hypothetical protein